MGACVSRRRGCGVVGFGLKKERNRNRTGRRTTRRVVSSSKRVSSSRSFHRTYSNPAFQGSGREAWFDPVAAIESDDDFYSVCDEFQSVNGSESAAGSIVSTPSESHRQKCNCNSLHTFSFKEQKKPGEQMDGTLEGSVVGEVPNNVIMMNMSSVHVDEFITSQLATNVENDKRVLQHSSMLLNSCLGCLASTDCSSLSDKRKASSPRSLSFKKKMALKLSFKRKEGEATPPVLCSPRTYVQRPLAGSQIPCCPNGKKMANCWSRVEPSTFKVRGKNFYRDKKKEMAPNATAFYPFGVDVFLSQRKIDHIARFVELPVSNSTEKVPPILVVNIQMPLYPAAMFQSGHDGEGMSIVLYFMLSESCTKDLPSHMRENVRGNKAEDLPEHLLCCIRLNEIDYTKCHQLCF
ncbi:Protein ENHANCED DISEASE RESISTANCE 2, C-terminal [Dillenia turbinata]|uniref:Protein ENHANCED DISEASE RESISTANCE 2, C-terminal n=1 Tax=Dillenia turbinata TaxID=194707 RepID=A0AAN8UMB7_9MAGN